jgi:hypothetical protein
MGMGPDMSGFGGAMPNGGMMNGQMNGMGGMMPQM